MREQVFPEWEQEKYNDFYIKQINIWCWVENLSRWKFC